MLIRFGCSNYRSISDYQEILFTASTLKDTQSEPFIPNGDFNKPLLTSIALYGANASGKTNLLLALWELVEFVISSHTREKTSGINRKKFKFNENGLINESQFDIDFIFKNIHYHYGFKIDDKMVIEEWLYSYSYKKRVSRKILFHRNKNENEEFYFGSSLKGKNKIISQLTRPNSLFVSAAAQNNHEILQEIYNYFLNKFFFRFQKGLEDLQIIQNLSRIKYLDQIIVFLSNINTGIKNIEIKTIGLNNQQKRLINDMKDWLSYMPIKFDIPDFINNESELYDIEIHHENRNGQSVSFKLDEESLGTKSIIALLIPIFDIINNGGILIVDEIESSLHPLLTLEVIRLFSKSTTNPLGAQIFFSTHETNILCSDVLRRDQIWFSEKTANGNTIVTPLTDFSLRKNYNIESGYLEGRFGAIPFLGDIKKLFQRETSNNGQKNSSRQKA